MSRAMPGRERRDRRRDLADLRLEQRAVALADPAGAGGGPFASTSSSPVGTMQTRGGANVGTGSTPVDARSRQRGASIGRARRHDDVARGGRPRPCGRRSATAAPPGGARRSCLRRRVCRVLDHHDGVGAVGERRARHDLAGLPRSDRAPARACPRATDPEHRERGGRRAPRRPRGPPSRPSRTSRTAGGRPRRGASRASTRPNASDSGTSSIRRPDSASPMMMRRASALAITQSSVRHRRRRARSRP